MISILSFFLFTASVAVATWLVTRGKPLQSEEGFFLAGRSLSAIFIAGSLLLTNLSTEQLVGLNGGAFKEGLSVMAWEVIAGLSLVVMALVFLPRYLKSGIATIPQFLEDRYDGKVRSLVTGILIVAYMLILLPFVLYSGARALSEMLDLARLTGWSESQTIWALVIFIALVGSAYAIFGGLRAVAVSDTFNGAGLFVGGLLITYFALKFVAGEKGSVLAVFSEIKAENPDAFRSLGAPGEDVHWPTLFTGVLLLNFFYWCSNQQIIQRAFAAKNLAEGQKGVLLAAFFKILAPIILVLPGILALHVANHHSGFSAAVLNEAGVRDDSKVYGALVRLVLPHSLIGLFAAAVVGSILSTFNSVLNSSATLFSLGVYKTAIHPGATPSQVVKSGRICSAAVTVFSAVSAPLLFMNIKGIFAHFQKLNAIYFIPLLAVVLLGLFEKRSGARAAMIAVLTGLVIMIWATFPGEAWVRGVFGSSYHFMGAVFVFLILLQLGLGRIYPRPARYVQRDAGLVDLTPWKPAKLVGGALMATVVLLYLLLARG